MSADVPAPSAAMQEWLDRWDAQQEAHNPDRPQRFDVLADLVEAATAGRPDPLVLDLACGPGSVTRHLLDRLAGSRPTLRIVALDVDPVLLQIAAGTIGREPAVQLVEADLREADWATTTAIDPTAGGRRFDAIVTATALHWLPPADLERLYEDLAQLTRPGGLFADGDHVPLEGVPNLRRLTEEIGEQQSAPRLAQEGAYDSGGVVAGARRDPAFTESLARRRRRFSVTHPAEFIPPENWHIERLVRGGFSRLPSCGAGTGMPSSLQSADPPLWRCRRHA